MRSSVRWKLSSLSPLVFALGAFCETTAPAPSLELALGAPTLAISQGQNKTVTVTVTRSNFSETVTLGATGLPAGVAATFNPASLAGSAQTSTLTLAATATATPGIATVTIQASGTGVESKSQMLALDVAVTGTFTIAAAPGTATVTQGASAIATISVTRNASFAQDVTLAATGLPTGVTASFSAATVSGSATSSTLTLNAASSAPTSTTTVTITGTTPGLPNQTTTLGVTVQQPAAISLALSASTVTVTQGQSNTITVTIGRTNFTGAVTLAATGLPSGISASFNPETVPNGTTTSALTLSAAGTAATTTATITVTASASGLTSQTATTALTVAAAPTVAVALDFCPDETIAWFAYQNDGVSSWTRVTPDANNTFTISATSKVGVAIVSDNGSTFFLTTVLYLSRAELEKIFSSACTIADEGSRTLNGSFAGLSATAHAHVRMMPGRGTNATAGTATQTFSVSNLPSSGPMDLIAGRYTDANGFRSVDRYVVRRSIDLPSGSTMPVIDFAASEAVPPATATVTVTGFTAGNLNTVHTTIWRSHRDTELAGGTTTGNSATVDALPADLLASGEIQAIRVRSAPSPFEVSTSLAREAAVFFRTNADRTVGLGPALSVPTFTSVASSPYARFRGQLPSQADYPYGAVFSFTQSNRLVSIGVSAGYLGAVPTTWDLTIPDFSGVTGWQNTWGLANASTGMEAEARAGSLFFDGSNDGDSFKFATSAATTMSPSIAGGGISAASAHRSSGQRSAAVVTRSIRRKD
jgi:hypothetical protein